MLKEETKNATEVEMATGNRERTASKVDVDAHLSGQEVATDAIVKEEANAQEIERVKIGSNDICIREDLPKTRWCLVNSHAVLSSKWAMWS